MCARAAAATDRASAGAPPARSGGRPDAARPPTRPAAAAAAVEHVESSTSGLHTHSGGDTMIGQKTRVVCLCGVVCVRSWGACRGPQECVAGVCVAARRTPSSSDCAAPTPPSILPPSAPLARAAAACITRSAAASAEAACACGATTCSASAARPLALSSRASAPPSPLSLPAPPAPLAPPAGCVACHARRASDVLEQCRDSRAAERAAAHAELRARVCCSRAHLCFDSSSLPPSPRSKVLDAGCLGCHSGGAVQP